MKAFINGNALTLPFASKSVQCVITSPPYYRLRDYKVLGQLGQEAGYDCQAWAIGRPACAGCYVCAMRRSMKEVYRVLKNKGVLWLNIGDTSRKKNLLGIPWRVALALQSDGWLLRQSIIWHKLQAMPESVKDRCTFAHEHVFILTKQPKYYWNKEAILEPFADERNGYDGRSKEKPNLYLTALAQEQGRRKNKRNNQLAIAAWWNENLKGKNKRDVWSISHPGFSGAHFATFPPDLVEPMILATSRPGDIVLDPFAGAGTVGLLAVKHGRKFVGVELNRAYIKIARERTAEIQVNMLTSMGLM